MEPTEFLSQPYGARSLITFVDDDVPPDQSDNDDAAALRRAFPNDVIKELAPILWGGIVGHVAVEIAKQLKEAWKDDVPVVPVPTDWEEELSLPPGHPREGVLYVAHPADKYTYVQLADFHRFTFEHKFAEAIRILMNLGATTIRVEREHGWGRDFAGKLSVGIPESPMEGGGSAGSNRNQSADLLYKAELEGQGTPEFPQDLVWYPYEPTWQNIVQGRMDFGLKRFSMKVHYNDDYGINADLSVGAANAGFEMGGRFEKHESTVWSIEGTFGE